MNKGGFDWRTDKRYRFQLLNSEVGLGTLLCPTSFFGNQEKYPVCCHSRRSPASEDKTLEAGLQLIWMSLSGWKHLPFAARSDD